MGKIKVLIVDDQNLMRDGLKTILETQNDIEVCGLASDGLNALKKVEETVPDVVLMDIRMPNMDGVECTKAIKSKYKDIKIIMLTTFDDREYIVNALSYGASGYILKDIFGEKLIKVIREAFNGMFIMPSEVAMKFTQVEKDVPIETKKETVKFNFSESEHKVAELLAEGFTNKQIAVALYMSEGTVKNCVSSIYNKLGMSNRAAVALHLSNHSHLN